MKVGRKVVSPLTMKARAIRTPKTAPRTRRISFHTTSRRTGGRSGLCSGTRLRRHHKIKDEAVATGKRRHVPSRPKVETACPASKGPTVRASSPATVKKAIPRPTRAPASWLIITGPPTWRAATLKPTVRSRMESSP